MRLRLIAPLLMAALAAFLSGCEPQTMNSLAGDKAEYGSTLTFDLNDPAQARFAAANTVMVKKCASCHTEFTSYTEAEWQSLGFVTAGDPSNSKLYKKLKGSDTGGDENMPPTGSLSQSQLNAFNTWITNIGL